MLGDIGSIVQAAATVLGVIIGAAWTAYLFLNRRGRFPRANVSHQITARRFRDDSILLMAKISISNVGDVLIQIESGIIRLNQILPVRSDILADIIADGGIEKFNLNGEQWPDLADRALHWPNEESPEIEPNEIDEFNYDFIIPSEAKVIEVYTYFTNVKKPKTKKRKTEIGWGHTSNWDLTDPKILPNDRSNC